MSVCVCVCVCVCVERGEGVRVGGVDICTEGPSSNKDVCVNIQYRHFIRSSSDLHSRK